MNGELNLYRIPAVNAALRIPVPEEDGPGVLTFYARGYLVWAADPAGAISAVTRDVEEDSTVLDVDPVEAVDPASLEKGMRRQALSAKVPGVCWRSGRMFYPPE